MSCKAEVHSNVRGRRSIAALALAAVIIGVAIAAPLAAGNSSSQRGTAQKKIVIGFASPILAGQPDQAALLLGQRKAAAALGWTVKALDAQLSVDKQISHIDTFISQGASGITTFALDSKAAEPAFRRANRAHIPVVGFTTQAPHVNTNVLQTIEGCSSPTNAAKFIATLKPGAKVLVMGPPPVPPLLFRAKCFETAAQQAGLNVLERQDETKDVAASAQAVAAPMITRHPDVEAWWVSDDTQALGVAAALRESGKTIKSASQDGVILIAGCCGGSLGANAVKSGQLTAVYDNNSPCAGAAAIGALVPVIKGKKPISAMKKLIQIPWKRYDFTNIASYVPYTKRNVRPCIGR
jgi:ribose transport system substrate-binding protein